MKLSVRAWKHASMLIQAIKKHPFNQELMKGCLTRDQFAYYIEQDSLYLKSFAQTMGVIASRVPVVYTREFEQYAKDTLAAEQQRVHQFFQHTWSIVKTKRRSPALIHYTQYLARVCTQEPVEVAVASVLPCFWVYQQVGLTLAENTVPNNPYARWIENYASAELEVAVKKMIQIFDELGHQTSAAAQEKMLHAFYQSTDFEWKFWDDAYHHRVM